MAAFNKFNVFVEHLAEGVHNLQSAVLKVMLTNSAPTNTNVNTSQLSEIPSGNGYSANGITATVSSSGQTSGTYKLVLGDVVFTATGGPMAPFRYVVLYNYKATAPARPVIAWWDYGSTVTLNNGETFTVDFDDSNGVLTLA